MSQSIGPLSKEHLIIHLRRQPREVIKVVFFGNSGRGKSFLANSLLKREVFRHDRTAGSVTREATYAIFVPEATPNRCYVLCNVPGFVEGDEARLASNKAQIQEALELSIPNSPTIVLTVMSPLGGRLQSEDVDTVKALLRYCPSLKQHPLGVLLNWKGNEEFRSASDLSSYLSSFKTMLEASLKTGVILQPVDAIPSDSFREPDLKNVLRIHCQVRSLMHRIRPVVLGFDPSNRLEREVDQLAGTLNQSRSQSSASIAEVLSVVEALNSFQPPLSGQQPISPQQDFVTEARQLHFEWLHETSSCDFRNIPWSTSARAEPKGRLPATGTGKMEVWRVSRKLSQQQVVDTFRSLPPTITNAVKVVLLGNSGRGKSFLCNCLAGYNLFDQAYQATSVTAKNEYCVITTGAKCLIVCNVPGLIEVNAEYAQRNKECIAEALSLLPQVPTVSPFVISAEVGGRVCNEDIQAYQALCKWCPALQTNMFVLNSVDEDAYDDLDAKAHHFVDIKQLLEKCLMAPCILHGIPRVPNRMRSDFQSPAMLEAHAAIRVALEAAPPKVLVVQSPKELKLRRDELVDELEVLRKAMERAEEENRRQREADARAYEARVAAERQAQAALEAQRLAIAQASKCKKKCNKKRKCCCFEANSSYVMKVAPNSEVLQEVPMSTIVPGDVVLGFNLATKRTTLTTVLAVDRHPGECVTFRQLTMADGRTIQLTDDHLLLTETERFPSKERAPLMSMAPSSDLKVEAHVFVAEEEGSARIEAEAASVVAMDATVGQPVNLYTMDDTIIVNGVICSCYAISEGWGKADMFFVKNMEKAFPGSVSRKKWYDALRQFTDPISDWILCNVVARLKKSEMCE